MNSTTSPKRGRPRIIPQSTVDEIRRRAAEGLVFGEQKVIAYELGVSCAYVNQIIRGWRRKPAA